MNRRVTFIRLLVFTGLAILLLRGEAIPGAPAVLKNDEPVLAFANPAAVYCTDLGYEYALEEGPEGQSGACLLPDGLQCDEWAFLAGKCGAEFSYCALHGYKTVTRSDGQDPFSPQYAVCTKPDGQPVGTVSELSNLAEKAQSHGCQALPPDPAASEKVSSSNPAPLALAEAYPTARTETENDLPSSFDWRNYNGGDWMTPVKNQGGCGSCWAFAVVGTTEAAHNIAADNPDLDLDLAEQYLVADCFPSNNCCGGSAFPALDLIRDQGIPDEACMPYVDGSGCNCPGSCSSVCLYNTGGSCSDRTCSDRCANWEARLVQTGSHYRVNSDVSKMKTILVTQGPLSTYIRMNGSFDGDIYRCVDDSPITHAVVLVGYDDAGGYWIAKNSWGSTWNGDGYFKVGYGECNIEYFPLVVGIEPVVPDIYEPDDTSGQAHTIYPGILQNHNLTPDYDRDWVKFELSSESGVVLETSGEFGDTWMELYKVLYDDVITAIEHNDDISYPENTFSRIERECGIDGLPPGKYYGLVSTHMVRIPSYDLSFQVESCVTPDAYEPDNSAGAASSITDGVPQTHNIVPKDDRDWVSFYLPQESAILLETSGPSGDTRMWLYDGDLDELEYNDDGQGLFSRIDRECATDPLLTGRYYLKIDENGNNDVIPTYDLSYTVVETCTPAEINFQAASYDAGEQDGSAWVEVALSKASWQVEQVDYATIDGSALGGADYEPLVGTLSFEPGVISRTLEISLLDDQLDEPDETLTLQLSNPSHAVLGDLVETTLTIRDDDPQPIVSLSEAGYFVTESNDQATISVTLSAPSSRDIHVSYATQDGTATAGSDYTGVEGELLLPAGTTHISATISILPDEVVEPDETFTIELNDPLYATLGTPASAVVTIEDDDLHPLPSITALSPASAVIGSQPITLEVHGSGFVEGVSVVRCNGAERSTSFISANELHALLPASDLASLGELQISVHNPTPGGGESAPHPFQILPLRLFLPFVKY
jgi:C1A family cysteine protease